MANKENNNKQATAKLRHLRMSPRKVRLLADIIRGMPAQEAEAQLMFSPRRASEELLKLLRSAVANAENNYEMNPHKLFIKEIRVDQGPTLKRWRPRARGAVNEIQKKTSHISIILEEKDDLHDERFIITKETKEKPKDKDKDKHEHKPEDRPDVHPEREAEKPKERKSPFKKIFRRKSV